MKTNTCKALHTYFNKVAHLTRTEAINRAIALGYNRWTARTQYQTWFALQNEVADQ
jgi:hypothetical protein